MSSGVRCWPATRVSGARKRTVSIRSVNDGKWTPRRPEEPPNGGGSAAVEGFEKRASRTAAEISLLPATPAPARSGRATDSCSVALRRASRAPGPRVGSRM
eukprot:scaffold3114_cov114-Isochrysis_galbana.AAC.6